MLLLPTRTTSSTSSRAIFLRAGIASATSPAWRRPDGVLAMVPPVATTFTSGSFSWACAALAARASTSAAKNGDNPWLSIARRKMGSVPIFRIFRSLPSAVVDRVLVGGARGNELPAQGPLISVLEALAGVGLRRRVEDAGEIQVLQLEQSAGLLDE